MILPQSGPREGAGEIPMMTNTMVGCCIPSHQGRRGQI